MQSSLIKKILIFLAIIIVIIIVVYGIYLIFSKSIYKTKKPLNQEAGEVNIGLETINKKPKIKNLDDDNDGLTNNEEKTLGINPNAVDSDDDGLFDRDEVKVYKTDPLNPDTDGDGVLDGVEVRAGFNPNGLGRLYISPGEKNIDVMNDDLIDSDNDGLVNSDERKYKTDIFNPDTDGDGYLDGDEVKNGYNPNGAGKL